MGRRGEVLRTRGWVVDERGDGCGRCVRRHSGRLVRGGSGRVYRVR